MAIECFGSPAILNRQFGASLTPRDGGSLLMGGLVSGNRGGRDRRGGAGPAPAAVPGSRFRTDAVQEDGTELMAMVTPCVIADHEEGWELARRIRGQVDLHTGILR